MGMFSGISNAANDAASDIGDAINNTGDELGNAADFSKAVGQRAWDNFAFAWIDPVLAENTGGIQGALRATSLGVMTAVALSPYQQVLPAMYLGEAAAEIAAERGWIDPLSVSENSPVIKALADADKAVRTSAIAPVNEAIKDGCDDTTNAVHDFEKSLRDPFDQLLFGSGLTEAIVYSPYAPVVAHYVVAKAVVKEGVDQGYVDPSVQRAFVL